MLGGLLYKRGFDGLLLRCLSTTEIPYTIKEVHDGICGGHFSGLAVAKRILRLGYYWPTLNRDCCDYVQHCAKCQQHANLNHVLSHTLQVARDFWPFSQWGLDLVGEINPNSSFRHRWIITVTEYFTKWVEAIPLISTKVEKIVDFINHHIICRFGVAHKIIANNGKSFKNKHVRKLCDAFGIRLSFSMPYYPQENGQAEASNKTLNKILMKVVSESGIDWHTHVPFALWAYRTSIRTLMGATPFSLVYGTEVVLPLEVQIPSLRISLHDLVSEDHFRQERLAQLELLDERHLAALNHLHLYQKCITRAYNKHPEVREFNIGDLILKENQHVTNME